MQFRGYPVGVAANVEEPPVVQVTGEGRLEVVPDTAVVSLGFTVRAAQAADAYQQTAAALSKVVRALLDAGVAQDQMQTQQITLQPVYEKEELKGYEGSSVLRVTVRDLAAVGGLIDRAVAAGANTVQGVTFEVRDRGAHEAAALNLAVQDAQRTAAVLARSLGIRLGRVWRTEAEPAPGPVLPVFARAAALEGMPVLPGTLTFIRRVRVEYLIQQHP